MPPAHHPAPSHAADAVSAAHPAPRGSARRRLLLAAGAAAGAAAIGGRVTAADDRTPRIGFLSALSESAMAQRAEALRQGLKEQGYVEGRNLRIEYRYADGHDERIGDLVRDLERLGVAAIVTTGPTSTRPARAATRATPIIMGFDPDPVGSGFVASLAKPGGNVTGLSAMAPQVGAKQLSLLAEMIPRLARVAVFANSTTAGSAQTVRELEAAAQALHVRLTVLEVDAVAAFEPAFESAIKAQSQALIIGANAATTNNRMPVIRLAARHRLPAMYVATEFVEEGGFATYGVATDALFRRAATYVHRILKGAKPADLPVEQPTVFDLAINLKTARALGLKVPQSILVQATRVIE